MKKNILKILSLFVILLLVNVVSYFLYERFDLTADNRYTLSSAAKEIVAKAEEPVIVDVFLKGDFPPEFRRLQMETRQLLEEFASENSQIKFNFIDPLEDGGNAQEVATAFYQMGMTPARINVVENGRSSEAIIFPWAMANYGNKSVSIQLLKNKLGATTEERVENSVQQLEYVFADAFAKLLEPRKKKVAVMRGNGELTDAYIADLVRSIQKYYFTAPFTLDSVAKDQQGTLEQLQDFDLVIEAKPTQAYTEEEKYVLDQYLMNGGKQLWMLDQVAMETDSLFTRAGSAFALPRNLNLSDYFFKYGLRVNPLLVKDLYSAPIILATGSGNETEFNPYPWFYYPLSSSAKDHPIVNNIEAVKFEYASPIDTLDNGLQKTILLSSSPKSLLEGLPKEISLDQITSEPDLSLFSAGEQPLAVLVDGAFTSVYKNRVKPFELPQARDEGEHSQLLLIADGDIAKNDLQQGQPLELGFDRYTGTTYGNKEFLLNAVNYLLDDTGLINIRSKKVSIAFLDLQKVEEKRDFWQLMNLVLPLVILGLFALIFTFVRRKKYIRR
ncbi:gliding motility-associated ABC transporter substrate-binding protein GldG [Salinimicrobium soli]|uniref:gliding motility-associated ABC transporter substrate-binding protein GldG n=1 Tax=Salinimicrobium soli TaxID=1254399 RepID=UPI003AAD64B2